jgi:hypothetical protein
LPSVPDPLDDFLKKVRVLRKTGQGTAEQSFYPAVFGLLDALGHAGTVKRAALAHPAGLDGDFPDVALYERVSNVLVLPVEVKPASVKIKTLLASTQAKDYARTFGGGTVLLTNLREWVVGRLDDSGALVEDGRVTLAVDETDLDKVLTPGAAAFRDLTLLVESACQVRGSHAAPKGVARLLAYHARNMRDAIEAAGDPKVLLASINKALADGLQIDLDEKMLVPTVVQTLVYGEFAAWLSVADPQHFDWMQASYRLNVPVFAEILHESLRPALLRKCDLTGHLQAVARVLSWTDRSAFAAAFDGDAIQYFYEPFLAEFDSDLRDALGVWYTPKAVAEYQVARADHHLRTDLGIPDGLADPTVYLLDPAVGTGTYLIAVCSFIFEFHVNNGEPPQIAAERAQSAMVKRLVGFEILPAAFIICHLHLARHLEQLGAPPTGDRLRVYLTNSLTGWLSKGGHGGMTLFPELEEELHDAEVAKHHDPVIVVLGNPPYQGYSTAETEEEQQMLQPWLDELRPVWGLRKHRLNDLYVRFWRVAIERVVSMTDRGVVSFITNRKWLGGRSYPSMRGAVVSNFDLMYVDDLHGAVDDNTHPGDQSVFTTAIATGITRGTAIVTAVRTGGSPTTSVWAADYWGSANDKRANLAARRGSAMNTGYTAIPVSQSSRYRLVPDAAGDYPALDEYLPFFLSGVQPVRDEAVLATDRQVLATRMKDYFDTSKTLAEVVAAHPGFGVTRARYDAARTRKTLLTSSAFDEQKIVRYLFRPFDTRWLYWEPEAKLLNEPRRALLPYWRNVDNQVCLVVPQTPRRKGAVRPIAGGAVGGFASAEPDARVFPLRVPTTHLMGEAAGELGFEEPDVPDGATTVAPEWVAAARELLVLTDDAEAGEVIFYALLAVMHSPAWIEAQPAEMDDFPQVPLPGQATDLQAAAEAGRRLALLLDPDADVPGVTSGSIRTELRDVAVPDSVTGTVGLEFGRTGERAGKRDGDSVLWSDSHGWRSVPDEVWEFTACGFQVLPKWLSYRKEAGLSATERETFRMIVRRIQAVLDESVACDAAYAAALATPLLATAADVGEASIATSTG